MQERRSSVLANGVTRNVLVRLDGAQPIEKLTDQDGEAGRSSDEEVDATDVAPATARLSNGINEPESGVKRLTRGFQISRLPILSAQPHVAAESGDLWFASPERLAGARDCDDAGADLHGLRCGGGLEAQSPRDPATDPGPNRAAALTSGLGSQKGDSRTCPWATDRPRRRPRLRRVPRACGA